MECNNSTAAFSSIHYIDETLALEAETDTMWLKFDFTIISFACFLIEWSNVYHTDSSDLDMWLFW